MATVTRERELLRELVALVRGECPSLLNEDSGGDVRLSMAIDAALAAPPAEDADRAPSLGTVTFDHKAGTVSYAPRHAAQAPPASDPPGLVNLVKELADSLEVMLRHRHGQAHNGDVVTAGKYETCRLCEPARVLIEEARAYPLPASPQAETKGGE